MSDPNAPALHTVIRDGEFAVIPDQNGNEIKFTLDAGVLTAEGKTYVYGTKGEPPAWHDLLKQPGTTARCFRIQFAMTVFIHRDGQEVKQRLHLTPRKRVHWEDQLDANETESDKVETDSNESETKEDKSEEDESETEENKSETKEEDQPPNEPAAKRQRTVQSPDDDETETEEEN